MRYPASEKLEIIRLVEKSHLPVRRTLDKLGIPSTTFYRWYDRYRAFGTEGLEDRTSDPGSVWNRIPDDVRQRIVDLALEEPELSPRELAVRSTDNVIHTPRLLSDNGSSYISGDLADWLEDQGMDHVLGAPYHPQTQGNIERWHQTLKNRVLLKNYYLPGDLKMQIGTFVDHCNNHRYHESLGNVTPADTYFGRDTAIIERRKKIKKLTIQNRRLNHQRQTA
jgi:transposase InsO family protein